MAKFRKKPEAGEIEAEQYLFAKRDHPFFHQAGLRSNHAGSYIPNPEGILPVNEGDYLVRTESGYFYTICPEAFESTYEAVEE